MEDDAAARSSGGLTALSHRLMNKLSTSFTSDRPAANGEASTKSGNLVFSPVSIYSALSLAAAGARGKTLSELLDALGAKSRESLAESVRGVVERALPDGGPRRGGGGGPRVAHACGVWHHATLRLKPAYRAVAAASCNAVVHAVDFITKPEEARKQINSWVAKKTSNLIDSVLPPEKVKSDTRVVVATAIYFKGVWDTPFDKSLTKEHKFHRLDGGAVDAQFMRSHDDQFIATYKGFKVLRMPYAAHDSFPGLRAAAGRAVIPRAMPPPPEYSMCVFLPDKRDGLWSLEEAMAASGPGFLAEHLPWRRVEVGDFRVPRFKLSFYDSLNRVLQDLGVRTVFDPLRADLPDMVEGSTEPLYLADVFHRAVIEVNEEGTEAAASTALCFGAGCAGPGAQRPKPVDFVADHPFAFFVVEEVSGAILFAGHVLDPTKS
ncbi:unnamed protein product [Urochloa decumbens]|uniref:Serpin domain-containing protein n=1 Tax=Urochloa decumbens TaxID=240449 RepID=A0ABC9GA25_9POAL